MTSFLLSKGLLLSRHVNYSGAMMSALKRCYSDFTGPPPTEPGVGAFRDPRKTVGNRQAGDVVPRETDIVIIGGGLAGMATAYFLKKRFPRGYTVTLVEKDPSYTNSCSSLLVGGIRHQFSLTENVLMSLFASDFLLDIKENLSILDLDPPDVEFNHQGYLLLASESDAHLLEEDYETQVTHGARIELMSKSALSEKFPWLNVNNVAVGSYGLEKEGWLDPWLLLAALKAKAASLGVQFVTGEVVGFAFSSDITQRTTESVLQRRDRLVNIHVRTCDGRVHPIQFAACVCCAGASSADIGRLARIGVGSDAMAFSLPIVPRKRHIYLFHCPIGPGLDMPMLVDDSGIFVRREGLCGHYISGADLPVTDINELAQQLSDPVEYFQAVVHPHLIQRIPAFEKLELIKSWSGFIDYNFFDQNLIIGSHPYHRNFYMAAGSSGYGALHALAVGRALMECVTDDGYNTLDLSRFTFDRVLDDEPLVERRAY